MKATKNDDRNFKEIKLLLKKWNAESCDIFPYYYY